MELEPVFDFLELRVLDLDFFFFFFLSFLAETAGLEPVSFALFPSARFLLPALSDPLLVLLKVPVDEDGVVS